MHDRVLTKWRSDLRIALKIAAMQVHWRGQILEVHPEEVLDGPVIDQCGKVLYKDPSAAPAISQGVLRGSSVHRARSEHLCEGSLLLIDKVQNAPRHVPGPLPLTGVISRGQHEDVGNARVQVSIFRDHVGLNGRVLQKVVLNEILNVRIAHGASQCNL